MNRIVLGLDRAGHHETALRLLARLRLRDATVDLLHVFEMPAFFGDVNLPISAELMAEAIEDEKDTGRRLCEAASARLENLGMSSRAPHSVGGYPAAEIMDYADRIDARLIAIGSTKKGVLRALLMGSISRALVIGAHQSVLIGKGEPAGTGALRAVLATDHSAYADRCLPELLSLAPQGISRLTILSCYPQEFIHAMRPMLPEFVLDPAQWIETNLRERNEQVARTLAPLGCEIETRVFSDTPATGIPQVMQETGSDLLILGAQGHGFLDRLKMGSTSYHQVTAEAYPVLLLRVPPKKA